MSLCVSPISSTRDFLRFGALAALCIGMVAALPGVAAAAGSGPVAAYSFDEGAGETVADLSGHGHTATIHGAEWTTRGHYGGAMEFEAEEEDYLSVPDSPELDFTEEFTLEAWVRPTSDEDAFGPLITKQTSGSRAQPYFLYEGSWDPNIPYGGTNENTEEGSHARAEVPLPLDAWSHLALTFDGATSRLYVDGSLVSAVDTTAPVNSEGDLEIGAAGEVESFLQGRIDEARVYDRVLSADEVGLDMETPLQTPRSGPVAAWSFDEGKGTTATDVTGHGHTATISKATWARGRFGSGLKFDGKKSCVTVPGSPELDFTEELTLEAWVRPVGSGPEAGPVLVQDDNTAGPTEEGYVYYLLAGENEVPKAWIRKAGSGFDGVYGTEPMPERAWSHETLTDDGAHLRLYIDGKLVRTAPAPQLTTGQGSLQIGCDIFGTHFEGRLDELRMYDRALTGAEVHADMEAPVQTPKTGPIASYSFDEGSGESVEDLTGNGHAATIQGADWTTHGRYGGALEFDAEEEDFVSIPASSGLDQTEELTVEAWVRPTATPEFASILMKEHEGSGPRYSYALYQHEDQTSAYFEETEEGSLISPEHSLPSRVWTHVAITDDGAYSRFYVNGQLVDTKPALSIEGHGEIRIGGNDIYGEWLDGRVDEIRIYDRALDVAELDADMETPLVTPKAGPAAAYSLDEGEGATAHDTTGHGHDAAVEGSEWTTHGRYGGAMEFDSSKEARLSVPDSPELDFTEEFTLEAWVRPGPNAGDYEPLVTKQKTGSPEQPYFLYASSFSSDPPYGGTDANSEDQGFARGGEKLPGNTWSHVALTYDGAQARLYVDGKLTASGAVAPPINAEGDLEIGAASEVGSYLSGRVDEVRIYGRGLTAAEVAADMAAPIQTPQQGPIAAWSFDEGEGTTAEDLTGDGHTATIEGAEWVRGKYGDALKFDGEDDVAKVADSPELALTEAFTIEAWVRPESQSNEWAPILAKQIGGGQAATELAWWLYEADAQANTPYGGTEPKPGEEDRAEADTPLPVGAWSHVALSWDGSKVRLYIDGELADCSPIAPAGAPPVTTGELQIGAATEHGDYFAGRIDEVRIYNRQLTQLEIQGTMNMTYPKAVTAPATEVESNDAIMTGDVETRGEGNDYFFEYGPTTFYGSIATGEEIEGNDGTIEVEETAVGLAPETTYHYRLVVENSLGVVYGKDKTFTTGERTMSEAEEEEERNEEEAPLAPAATPHAVSAFAKAGDLFGMMWDGDISQMVKANTFEAIENSGAKWFRFVAAPGAEVSQAFSHAANANLTPLPYLGAGPFPKPGTTAAKHFISYAEKIVQAHRSEAATWEIWNEPNMRFEINPGQKPAVFETTEMQGNVNPAEFAEFYKELVKAIRPSGVHILAPGLFGYKSNVNGHLTPRAFLKQFNEALMATPKLENPYGAVSLHPYVFKTLTAEEVKRAKEAKKHRGPHAPDTEEDAKQIRNEVKGEISGVRKLEKHMLGEDIPVWVTELGFPVKSEDNGKPSTKIPAVSTEEQGLLVHYSFAMLLASRKSLEIEHAFYYNIEDLPGPSWEHHAGLLNEEHRPRPAWTAFSDLAEGKKCPHKAPC